jgi:putative transposase
MPNYRRNLIPGGTFFFTVVTYQRRPILIEQRAREIIHQSLLHIRKELPFETIAICLLPDHLHCIWTLPEHDHDYPTRWKKIKALFSKIYLKLGETTGEVNQSRINKGEVGIWQRRYWEHTICDEKDLEHHIEDIHYNPVKHGLVKSTLDWPWSSFHRYVKMGLFSEEWGKGYKEEIDTGLVGE